MALTSNPNTQLWQEFLKTHAPPSGAFLQSWDWGTFQEHAGHKVIHLADEVDGKYQGIGQFIVNHLPFGKSYLFCPRGPIGLDLELIKSAFDSNSIFLRCEPHSGFRTDARSCVSRVKPVHPPTTLLTNLTAPEEQLLAAMHQKTRYNVKLAQKAGVHIKTEGVTLTDDIWNIFTQTATRGGFRLHQRHYYEIMLKTLKDPSCHAFLATAHLEDGTILAANIMIDCLGVRTYLHGASGNAHREKMAPYLLHWALIQDAKQKDLTTYDWWGIAPDNAPASHPWAGITRFKKGFGGTVVTLPGTFDLPFSKLWYGVYSLIRKFKK